MTEGRILQEGLREAALIFDQPHDVGGVTAIELETGDLLRRAADRIDELEGAAE